MSTEAVFRSQHPDVLAAWEVYADANRDLNVFAHDLEARFGRKCLIRVSGWGGTRVVGLSTDEDDNERRAPRTRPDLPGLRLGAKEGYWVPDKRTAEGRALADEMNRHRAGKPRYPGMPEEVTTEEAAFQSMVHTPGSRLIDGWVWVTWSVSAERLIDGDRRERRVDTDVWEHVRLSVYHAMLEAERDKEGADA